MPEQQRERGIMKHLISNIPENSVLITFLDFVDTDEEIETASMSCRSSISMKYSSRMDLGEGG